MAEVVIMRGLPGAGKSTWVRMNLPDAQVCSADSFFVGEDGEYRFDGSRLSEAHSHCLRRFAETVSTGGDSSTSTQSPATIVVDNTGISAWEISPYYNLARAFGHDVRIVHLKCSPETAHGRNVHGVSMDRVLEMDRKMAAEEFPPFWNLQVVEFEETLNG